MALASLIGPWSGRVCRHIPDGSPFDVLDMRFAGVSADNRWNRPGVPTLYLASDRRVLVAEFARHLADETVPPPARAAQARRIFDLELKIERLLDLRHPRVCDALSLKNAPTCFLDRELARATADFLRRAARVQAIIAPSAAFLDDLDRSVLVVFLETLDGGLASIVRSVTRDGIVRYDP